MRTQIAKLARSVRTQGPAAAWALAKKNIFHELRWFLDRRFDRKHGTETSDRIELDRLDVVGAHRDQGVYYEPTSTRIFRHIMDRVTRTVPCEPFVFLDYGSGKGRTLLMASDYPFQSILGVEFSKELHETALRNIAAYKGRRQRCTRLHSVHADATEFMPPGSDLLIYFFNPFLKDVMSRVLANVAHVVRASGRRVVLVYLNPLSSEAVEGSGLFVRREEVPLPFDFTREVQRKCCVYYSWPA
jgi:SAM-dependent methyltransferase